VKKSEIIELLAKTALFSPLGRKALSRIAEFCAVYTFPRGRGIFNTGDPGGALFIVESGEVSISRLSEDLRSQEIARFIAGDSFGELDLMTGSARNAEARAAENTRLLRFPRRGRSLQDLLAAHPDAGAELLHSFLRVTAGRIRDANALMKENSPWVQELRSQVYEDKLTGLYNKTFLEERLPGYLADRKRPVSVLMVKPDNFKLINDTFGHEAGDRALVLMAERLRNSLPESVVAIRYMGNEFACLLPDTDREKALRTAEDIRRLMNGLDFSSVTGKNSFRLSVSAGISVYPDHAERAPELIAWAHELPLIGRERGGNRILFPEDK